MGNYLSTSKENEAGTVGTVGTVDTIDTSIIDKADIIPPTPNSTPVLGSINSNEGTKIEVNPIEVTVQTDVFKKIKKNED